MMASGTVEPKATGAASGNAARLFLLISRLLLGAIFIYAGYVKLREPWQIFAMNINSYNVLPLAMAETAARLIPWFEIVLGLFLVSGLWLRVSGIIASAVLLTFIVLMVQAYLKGMHIDCGCFGSGEQISWKTLLRDGALAADAVAMTCIAFLRRRATSA